jgi:hypothetical protein
VATVTHSMFIGIQSYPTSIGGVRSVNDRFEAAGASS